MAKAIDRRQYGLRLQAAKEFYSRNQDKQLNNDPVTQYKFELGKVVSDTVKNNPQDLKSLTSIEKMEGNREVGKIDTAIGMKLIANGVCNEQSYAEVLDKHSPNAGIHQRTQRRDAYTKPIARSADKQVNVSNFKDARTKHSEQNIQGRAKSSLEERSEQSKVRHKSTAAPSNYQRDFGR